MQFIPVEPDDIPNFKESHRGRVSYPILKQFLETGLPMARLDRTGMQNSMMTLTSCLNSYIRNHDLPIKIFQRQGELYLMRLDLNADGSPKEPESAEQTVAAAPMIDDGEVERRFAEEVGQVTK